MCCTQNFLLKEARYLQNVHRVQTEHSKQRRQLFKGWNYWRINSLPFLAQAGATGSRRVNPSDKLKPELRFMPCYSATPFQCCLYVCWLERVETCSECHRRKAFPSEFICLCKTQQHSPLLFCSQSEGRGGWTTPKRLAVGLLLHGTCSEAHSDTGFLFLFPICFPSLNVKAMKSITDDKSV